MPEFRVIPFRGKFAVEWYDERGKRQRRSLGTDDRRDLESSLQRFKAKYDAERRPKSMTVSHVVARYQESLKGKASAETFDHNWKALGPHFGEKAADSITEEDCRAYYAARRGAKRSEWTVHSELGRLRSALSWGAKKNLIVKAPAIWRNQEPPPRDKRLTRAQARQFLDACDLPHVKLFVTLAVTTGARMGAILDLTWDRVDFARRKIVFHDPDRKQVGKTRATVPMNPMCERALGEAREGATGACVVEWGGGRVGSVKKALQAAGRRCGLPWVTAHVFRHSAATWMAEDGVPMTEIAQFLGHSNSKITEKVYSRFSPEYLAKAGRSLDLDSLQ